LISPISSPLQWVTRWIHLTLGDVFPVFLARLQETMFVVNPIMTLPTNFFQAVQDLVWTVVVSVVEDFALRLAATDTFGWRPEFPHADSRINYFGPRHSLLVVKALPCCQRHYSSPTFGFLVAFLNGGRLFP
ncbi:MAG: hypothetical protein U1C55_11760, partial [Smithellaceae bacterium]|nr:hypothetical protein [Smithellaceae bacterium]